MALQQPTGNQVLDALSQEEFEELEPQLALEHLGFGVVLCQQGDRLDRVYFPISCVVSYLNALEDSEIEVATVGNESMVGLTTFLGSDALPVTALVQVPGAGISLDMAAMRSFATSSGDLRTALQQASRALIVQLAQNVACNRHHSVEERAAKWILLTDDRAGEPNFPLTQEFLAKMLGVRRPTVSLAAGVLQRAGLIRYQRGDMSVLDRLGLEETSCECYRIIVEAGRLG